MCQPQDLLHEKHCCAFDHSYNVYHHKTRFIFPTVAFLVHRCAILFTVLCQYYLFVQVEVSVLAFKPMWCCVSITVFAIVRSQPDPRLVCVYQDEDAEFKINWKRVAITSSFGFGFIGPVGHFWFVFRHIFSTWGRLVWSLFAIAIAANLI